MSQGMEMKHSGLGIASFVVSLLVGAILMALVIVAGLMEAGTPGGIDEDSMAAVGLGLLLIAGMIGELVAGALGIAALLQSGRRKTFGVLGLVFAAMSLLGMVVLMIVGTLAG